MVIALTFAAYLALTTIKPAQLKLSQMDWAWAAVALAAAAFSYVAASMSLTGFVPEKLPFRRTVAAQLAGFLRQAGRAGRDRRHRAEHPLPAEGRDPLRAGGRLGRRLPAGRPWPGTCCCCSASA